MSIAQRIKQAVTMPEVAQRYGYKIHKGDFICCPFHQEKTASMKLYKNRYKCFGCGCGGDAISFVMAVMGCTFKETLGQLNEMFSLGLDINSPVDKTALQRHRQAQETKADLQETIQQTIWNLCDQHRQALSNSNNEYLVQLLCVMVEAAESGAYKQGLELGLGINGD